jgi:putative transcriptional regulator
MAGRRTDRRARVLGATVLGALALSGAVWAMSPPALTDSPTTAGSLQANPRDPVGALATGKLLVATRSLADRTFAESVVLLFSYAKDGAAGLVLNRPSSVPLARALPDLAIPKGGTPVVFFGGPVALTGVRALLRSRDGRIDGYRVLPDVYLLGTREAVDGAVADGITADRLRLYAGYAGWGAGQLEREVRRRDWFVLDGDSEIVFDAHPETLWRREIRLTDVIVL